MNPSIKIAGQTSEPEAWPEVNERTAGLPSDALAKAANESDFLEKLLSLNEAQAIRTADFSVPAKPGLAGRWMQALRRFLWKLLRYQHDQMAAQANALHAMDVAALRETRRQLTGKIAALEQRIRDLEKTPPPRS